MRPVLICFNIESLTENFLNVKEMIYDRLSEGKTEILVLSELDNDFEVCKRLTSIKNLKALSFSNFADNENSKSYLSEQQLFKIISSYGAEIWTTKNSIISNEVRKVYSNYNDCKLQTTYIEDYSSIVLRNKLILESRIS